MKLLALIPLVLAASQCPGATSDTSPETNGTIAADTATGAGTDEDVGVKSVDTGVSDVESSGPTLNLTPGPAPFEVPTERISLEGLDATMLVPVGTRVEKSGAGLRVRFGEGKNYWLDVSDNTVDLGELRNRLDSETSEPIDRFENAVVWNEGEFWFFQQDGVLSCGNPPTARHQLVDIDVMVASCRSIELSAEETDDAGEPPALQEE